MMLPEPVAWSFHRAFLDGLENMHRMGVVHRDLKPGNLLPFLANDCTMQLRIADVGQARVTSDTITPQRVTLWCRVPEVIAQQPYSTQIDAWASGCILAEMLTGSVRFPGNSEPDMLARMCMRLAFEGHRSISGHAVRGCKDG